MGWLPVTREKGPVDVVGALIVILSWVGGRGRASGAGPEQVIRAENAERGKRSGHEVRGLPLHRLRGFGTPPGRMSLFLSFYLLFIDWLASQKTSLLL